MSATGGDAPSLLACAAWLHDACRAWTDENRVVDVGSAQAELAQRLTAVKENAERHDCLPVKEALQLQLCGQDCWNATFLLSWPVERLVLKRAARHLAAYLFLTSHRLFAPPEVFEAHVSHHRDDAEKCILMCLKVSKALANHGNAFDEAHMMLTWASAIVAACRDASKVKVGQYAMEVHFAQLHVLWRSGRFSQACAMAEKLAEETQNSSTYREALFEFIYEAAFAVTCSADAAEEPSADEKELGASAECHNTTQALLSLSLRLQKQDDVRTVKQQSFLGTTELQLACLLLKTGAYGEAVEAAAAAYEHLHTFEPLVVRLKAESLRHNTESAAELFAALCRRDNTVAFAELCAIAMGLVESNPTMEEEVATSLQRRVASSPASADEEDRFRLLCFLLHVHSEWSVGELVRLLSITAKPQDQVFHRFFFCCLWQLALCDEEAAVQGTTAARATHPCRRGRLSGALKWECLKVAVTDFSALGSSDAERQSMLLDMSRLAVELQPDPPSDPATDDEDPITALQHTWELWRRETTVHPALHSPVMLAQAQLAFVLGKCDEGLQFVHALWSSSEEDDTKVQSCAALINFLLVRSMFDVAGSVAQRCLPRLAADPAQCRLDFAKVCALGSLASGEDALVSAVGDLFVAHVCPLLTGEEVPLSPTLLSWWSCFLWYISDRLLEGSPIQAVRLSYTGVCLSQKLCMDRSGDAACGLALLPRRLSALLEAEFDLYVAEQPCLTVPELRQSHTLLTRLSEEAVESDSTGDNGSSPESRARVTLSLATVEMALRQLEEAKGAEEPPAASMELDTLPHLPSIEAGDLEQVATVCHRVAARTPHVCIALRAAAVTLQIAAAETHCRRLSAAGNDGDAVYAVLSMLYDAYGMASSADARAEVFTALIQMLDPVTPTPLTEMLSGALKHRSCGNSPLAGHAARLAETAVEFFAVEAWNESVQWNVLQRRDEVARWRSWALTLADMLDSTNASKIAIADLAVQMPLL
ncbi:hypothetical protein ABB37_06061 [Leptomonas pyrrhocoris]|uniref:Uncharacterized protein n=1 Tax=Leptomonas pyrrhocoris TaxID=157538 RepID=A0A0M9FY96_LEPPY|nr:hypothetical protein ABB37_06061 [Leptomonas pyrrhocoris]KPA78433.1 hypothetical protein ABB37_06061 [Leptomonas pyrrhocoris]|eukprot:XP_015656872.1 hypothetical protein ABB37_06061 [Leptomonas pyrrhocoris]